MKTKFDLKFEEDVYKKYYPLVYTTCKRFLIDKCFLSDATQSVFLLYIKKEDHISSNLSSWFYWASVNICKVVNQDFKKHLEKSTPLNENAEISDEGKSQEEFFLDLGGVLEKLPTKKRDMLLMRYYENKTYREIGSYFKCKEDSVRMMIDRTLLFIKNEVKRKEVLSSVVFAQFFGLNSPASAIPATNQFILQNSLLQQSIINGVQKMYLFSKLKYALILFVCLSIPLGIALSTFIFADADQSIVKKSEESQNVKKTKSIVLQKEGQNQNYNNQKVVDQTLHSPIVKEEIPQANKDVLSSQNEKAEIEITLYDGEQNKLLIDYNVTLKYYLIDGSHGKAESKINKEFKTDKNGKIIFSTKQGNDIFIKICSKDYVDHTKTLALFNGKNEYQAKLYRGGNIEIHATNDENMVIEDLAVRIDRHYGGEGIQFTKDSLIFDAAKGSYMMSNIPQGIQKIYFKAPGYRETPSNMPYMVRIDPINTAKIDIRMKSIRKLYFELDVKEKPNFIYIELGFLVKNGNHPPAKTQKSFKNENGLYEFSYDSDFPTVIISADNYISEDFHLSPEINKYKVVLSKGYAGKIQIVNEDGKPMMGAKITYSDSVGFLATRSNSKQTWGTFSDQTTSNEEGFATIICPKDKLLLEFSVSHPDYVDYYETWAFDANEQGTKKCILNIGKSITGKIMFGDKIVMGATVQLLPKGSTSRNHLRVESGPDGTYSFNKLEGNADQEYTISAFHWDFGLAASPLVKLIDKRQTVDLELNKEKSLSIKLVDSDGKPIPNKRIALYGSIPGFFIHLKSAITDEKGEYEFFNLMKGEYQIYLNDRNLKINQKSMGSRIQVPTGLVVITAEQKKYKKIIIKTPGEGLLNGHLVVKSDYYNSPIDMTIAEDGSYYIDGDLNINGILLFETPGYAVVQKGPIQIVKDLPDDLIVEFEKGKNFKINVVDEFNNKPIPFANIEVSIPKRRSNLISMQTNEYGEIQLKNLKDKYDIKVTVDKYILYENNLDVSQLEEFTVKLNRGGGIKGQLVLSKNVKYARVGLRNKGYIDTLLEENGSFEIKGLVPGEYTLEAVQYFYDGTFKSKVYPAKVMIEKNKILEVNLDEIK